MAGFLAFPNALLREGLTDQQLGCALRLIDRAKGRGFAPMAASDAWLMRFWGLTKGKARALLQQLEEVGIIVQVEAGTRTTPRRIRVLPWDQTTCLTTYGGDRQTTLPTTYDTDGNGIVDRSPNHLTDHPQGGSANHLPDSVLERETEKETETENNPPTPRGGKRAPAKPAPHSDAITECWTAYVDTATRYATRHKLPKPRLHKTPSAASRKLLGALFDSERGACDTRDPIVVMEWAHFGDVDFWRVKGRLDPGALWKVTGMDGRVRQAHAWMDRRGKPRAKTAAAVLAEQDAERRVPKMPPKRKT